jgi:cell division protein FtsN
MALNITKLFVLQAGAFKTKEAAEEWLKAEP